MDQEIKQEVWTRLDALAEKLGVVSEHLWEVLVRQYLISGWISLITAVLGLLVGFGIPFLLRNRAWDTSACLTRAGVVSGISLFLGLASFLGLLINGSSMVTKIFNPEYHALKELLGKL